MPGNRLSLRRETATVAATPPRKFRLPSAPSVTPLPKLPILQVGVTLHFRFGQMCNLGVSMSLRYSSVFAGVFLLSAKVCIGDDPLDKQRTAILQVKPAMIKL